MAVPTRVPKRERWQYSIGVALVALTVLGLLLYQVLQPGSKDGTALLVDIGLIMGLALVKAYLVGAQYMDLRESVTWLKAIFCAWLLLTWGAIMTATYLGMHLDSYIHFL